MAEWSPTSGSTGQAYLAVELRPSETQAAAGQYEANLWDLVTARCAVVGIVDLGNRHRASGKLSALTAVSSLLVG